MHSRRDSDEEDDAVRAGTTRTFLTGTTALMALTFTALLIIFANPVSAQSPDEGADIYTQTCARCHQDDGLGVPDKYPPLSGNPDAADFDYVVDVVTNGLSGKTIMGVDYERDMPAFNDRLTTEEIQQVSTYTVQLSESGPAPTTPTTPPVVAGTASAGDALFRGSTLLSNGGVACIACHSAREYDRLGGPGLGMDLNGIIDEFGTAGFVDAITDPVVDEMIAVFADHPITNQEANDLSAFLEKTSADGAEESTLDLLMILGFVGFLVLILTTALIIRGPQEPYETKLRST